MSADDLVDEFEDEVVRLKGELQNHMEEKVLDFLSASNLSLFCRTRADRIKTTKGSFVGLVDKEKNVDAIPEGIGDKDKDEIIVGRKEEVSSLVATLINSNDRESLLVMESVGMGGVGKITVARLLYNEPGLKTYGLVLDDIWNEVISIGLDKHDTK